MRASQQNKIRANGYDFVRIAHWPGRGQSARDAAETSLFVRVDRRGAIAAHQKPLPAALVRMATSWPSGAAKSAVSSGSGCANIRAGRSEMDRKFVANRKRLAKKAKRGFRG